jgi:hypothetical protein
MLDEYAEEEGAEAQLARRIRAEDEKTSLRTLPAGALCCANRMPPPRYSISTALQRGTCRLSGQVFNAVIGAW